MFFLEWLVEEESEHDGQEDVEEENINVYLESEHPEICLRRGQRDGDVDANQKIFRRAFFYKGSIEKQYIEN